MGFVLGFVVWVDVCKIKNSGKSYLSRRNIVCKDRVVKEYGVFREKWEFWYGWCRMGRDGK